MLVQSSNYSPIIMNLLILFFLNFSPKVFADSLCLLLKYILLGKDLQSNKINWFILFIILSGSKVFAESLPPPADGGCNLQNIAGQSRTVSTVGGNTFVLKFPTNLDVEQKWNYNCTCCFATTKYYENMTFLSLFFPHTT